MEKNEQLLTVKRRFMAMRNGIIADTLRTAGAPYRVIFGLNVPQIAEIARDFKPDLALAEALWADSGVRESMLLAPMVCPVGDVDHAMALRWIGTAPSVEAIDMLCLKLLRRCDFAWSLVEELAVTDDDMMHYAAMRLMFNLLSGHEDRARELASAEAERQCRLTQSVARMIVDEVDFLKEEC